MLGYRLYLFGTPRLEYKNKPVAIDTRKALALIAYLLIEGQPQSRDTMSALLWPESDQSAARGALRRTLSTLRGVMDKRLLDFGRETLAVKPEMGLWCDVEIFNRQLDECKSHGHPEDQVCAQCLIPLQTAIDLYKADFLSGFNLHDSAKFDDWQFFEADRLRRTFAGVLEKYTLLQQEMGDLSTAITAARHWLNLDTLNESAHRALISLYAQNNQRNTALRQYRECVRILNEELGVAPLEETSRLYQAVKSNQFEGFLPNQPKSIHKTSSPSTTQNRKFSNEIEVPLIGRGAEWKQLSQIYDGIHQNGVFTVLSGEPGIGKTHLAKEFLTQLQLRGSVILSTQCYAGENNLAFTPLIDLIRQGLNQIKGKNWWHSLHPHWLSEVALLVPELSTHIPDLQPTPPLEGPGAQTRFYEGVSRVLTALVNGPIPGVIFIDSMEWVDESSMDLLAYFVRRLQGRPILLLVTWQTEGTIDTSRLDQMLRDTRLQGTGYQIQVELLNSDQALQLAELIESGKKPLPPHFKQKLVETSQGLPFFLVEYMHAAMAGEIHDEMVTGQWPIPTALREMYHNRFSGLSGSAIQILQSAAIIGGIFNSKLLELVSGRTEEEIVQGLEELMDRHLIRELPALMPSKQTIPHYDFKQDQIRTLVLDDISLVRRRLLHHRVADALLVTNNIIDHGLNNGQIAFHYQQAGLPEKAAEFYFQAGKSARAMHANHDALTHFENALALGIPLKTEAMIATGDLLTLMGNYPRAIQQYEAAAAFSTPASLPPIELKIGQVFLRRGSWEESACHFEAALSDLEVLPSKQRKAFEAQVRADWSLACHHQGKKEVASDLAQSALVLAEASAAPLALAQVHNLLGILSRSNGNFPLALDHLGKSISYARKLDNPAAQIAALNNFALVQTDRDEFNNAIETLEDALYECQNLGDRHLEAALRNNLADVLRARGQMQASIAQLKQAVIIFAEIGQNVEDWEPEIWKLVEW